MKQLLIASLVWLLASLIITFATINLFSIVGSISQISVLIIVMVAVGYLFRTASLFESRVSPSGLNKTSVYDKRNIRSMYTGLPTSNGVITGNSFGIPAGYTIHYRHAEDSPKVLHFYGKDDLYRGFIIDFGNGLVGKKDGVLSITNCSGNLQVKFTSPNGNQSIGWR